VIYRIFKEGREIGEAFKCGRHPEYAIDVFGVVVLIGSPSQLDTIGDFNGWTFVRSDLTLFRWEFQGETLCKEEWFSEPVEA